MRVGGYARVSREEQAQGEARSIEQQIAEIEALCKRMGWTLVETFVDCENYRATQAPNKGKIVNPSGERTDRPAFLAMLDKLKSGQLDAVACWRDDRLVRHPRVAVALEDALDLGDVRRNGRGKIEIYDATGAKIDRFTLSIKATIWREENKRRAERTRMGKVATLQEGRWPGGYDRLGYDAIKEPGKRGRGIVLAEPEEVQLVKDIFAWYDAGLSLTEVRARLIASGAKQKGRPGRTHEWAQTLILNLVHCPDYMGTATWNFTDGTEMSIEIPRIIEPEQWERVQEQIKDNKALAMRNAGAVYLLQGLLECGECNGSVSVNAQRYDYGKKRGADGKRPRKEVLRYKYRCNKAGAYRDEPHPRPYHWHGPDLDWAIWRHLVDNGISQPELLTLQIVARQEELRRQGENLDGEIGHARRRLSEVDGERAFYQRQAARKMITEQEFDARMAETEEAVRYWQGEIKRLVALRDDGERVEAGLSYMESLLGNLYARLPEIDLDPEELDVLPEEQQRAILEERRTVIRALCQKVIVWSNGDTKIIGALDGSEGKRFGLEGCRAW